MSKLQELLDEKLPMLADMSQSDLQHRIWLRQAFTEGYNAAKDEAKAGQVSDEDLRIFQARMQQNITPNKNVNDNG